MYWAVVVPTPLYDAETWVLYRKQIKLLKRFQQRCLRSILGIKWQDHESNEEVLERTNLPSIERVHFASGAAALGWPRHKDGRHKHMPKAIFFSKLKEGKRQRGAPRKRYKDQLKRQLPQAGISH